jgi:hypothetical protein
MAQVNLDVPGATPFFYLLISGIGVKESGEYKQLYTFTRMPTWSPTSTQKFIDGLYVPGSWSQSADVWGGVATASGLTLEIQDQPKQDGTAGNIWAELFALYRWTTSRTTYPQTFMTETMRPTDRIMWVQDTNSFPGTSAPNADRTIFVGMETMRYDRTAWQDFSPHADIPGDTRPNGYAFVNVTRNLFPAADDLPLEHVVQAIADGRQPIVTTVPRTMFGRMCALYVGLAHPDGTYTAEADCLRLWAGPIQQAEWVSGSGLWRLQCDSLLSLLDRRACSYLGKRRGWDEAKAGLDGPTTPAAHTTIVDYGLSPYDTNHIHPPSLTGYVDNAITIKIYRVSGGTTYVYALETIRFEGPLHSEQELWDRLSQWLQIHFNFTLAGFTFGTDVTLVEDGSIVQFDFRVVNYSVNPEGFSVRITMGAAIAWVLGYTDDGRRGIDTVREYAASEDTADRYEVAVPADFGYIGAGFWAREKQYDYDGSDGEGGALPVVTTRWFLGDARPWLTAPEGQGDGVGLAVMVGNRRLLRYWHKAEAHPYPYVSNRSTTAPTVPALYGVNNYLNKSDAADYGPNNWPRRFGQGARKKDFTDEKNVQQVLAPNPDSGIITTILHLMLSTGQGIHWVGADIYDGSTLATQAASLNGPYDVFHSGMGVAIPAGLVDTASFASVAASIPAELQRRSYVWKEGFSLKDLINAEGRLLGFNVVVRNGKIACVRVPSLATVTDTAIAGSFTIGGSNTLQLTEDLRGGMDRTSSMLTSKNVINAYTVKHGYDIANDRLQHTTNVTFPVSQMESGTTRALTMENKGLYGDSLSQTQAMLDVALAQRQALYGLPMWTYRRSYVYRLWPVMAPGQVVSLSDGRPPDVGVPDPFAGTLGLTNAKAAVLSCTYDYKGANGQVELLLYSIGNANTTTIGVSDGTITPATDGTTTTTTGIALDSDSSRGDGGWEASTERLYVTFNAYSSDDVAGVEQGMRLRVTDMTPDDPDDPPTAWVTVSGTVYSHVDGSYVTLAGQDLDAMLPGGWQSSHQYTAVEDPYGGTVPTDTQFYFRIATASGSNFGKMTRDDSSGITATISGTGFTVGTNTPPKFRALQYGAEVGGFSAGAPIMTPDNAAANCYRSEGTITGTFPAGTWTVNVWVQAVTSGSTHDGGFIVRLYKGANADGTGATEISGGDLTGSAVTNLTTAAAQNSTASASLAAVTFSNEYLFLSMTWAITGAGGSASDDVLVKVGQTSAVWSGIVAPLLGSAATSPSSRTMISSSDTSLIGDLGRWDPLT